MIFNPRYKLNWLPFTCGICYKFKKCQLKKKDYFYRLIELIAGANRV